MAVRRPRGQAEAVALLGMTLILLIMVAVMYRYAVLSKQTHERLEETAKNVYQALLSGGLRGYVDLNTSTVYLSSGVELKVYAVLIHNGTHVLWGSTSPPQYPGNQSTSTALTVLGNQFTPVYQGNYSQLVNGCSAWVVLITDKGLAKWCPSVIKVTESSYGLLGSLARTGEFENIYYAGGIRNHHYVFSGSISGSVTYNYYMRMDMKMYFTFYTISPVIVFYTGSLNISEKWWTRTYTHYYTGAAITDYCVNLTLASRNYTHLVGVCTTSIDYGSDYMYSAGSAAYLKTIYLFTDNVTTASMYIDTVKVYRLGDAVFTIVAPKLRGYLYYTGPNPSGYRYLYLVDLPLEGRRLAATDWFPGWSSPLSCVSQVNGPYPVGCSREVDLGGVKAYMSAYAGFVSGVGAVLSDYNGGATPGRGTRIVLFDFESGGSTYAVIPSAGIAITKLPAVAGYISGSNPPVRIRASDGTNIVLNNVTWNLKKSLTPSLWVNKSAGIALGNLAAEIYTYTSLDMTVNNGQSSPPPPPGSTPTPPPNTTPTPPRIMFLQDPIPTSENPVSTKVYIFIPDDPNSVSNDVVNNINVSYEIYDYGNNVRTSGNTTLSKISIPLFGERWGVVFELKGDSQKTLTVSVYYAGKLVNQGYFQNYK